MHTRSGLQAFGCMHHCRNTFLSSTHVLYVCIISFNRQVGAATAIGEQPIKALLSAEAGARLSVAEAITNLVFAPVTSLRVRQLHDMDFHAGFVILPVIGYAYG